jgi:uncharacterized protein YpbB
MRAIAEHVEEHGRGAWEAPPAPAARKPLNDTARETLRRFREGEGIAAIAGGRELAESTIWGHLAAAAEAGEAFDLERVLTSEQQRRIAEVFAELGEENLTGVVERLGAGWSYGQVKLFRAVRRGGGVGDA